MAIVEVRRVSKSHRVSPGETIWALREVSLAPEPGAVSVLVGPSGAGKTSLLSILGVLERPTSGQLLFRGVELATVSGYQLARVRRSIGQIYQNFALIPQLSILDNVTYPQIPRGVPRPERNRQATEWLGRLGITHKLTRPVRGLSGGELQRVAAARAFAGKPELLLADEPTSNLDETAGKNLIQLLFEARSPGVTVVVSTHDPEIIRQANHVYRMDAGRLHAQ